MKCKHCGLSIEKTNISSIFYLHSPTGTYGGQYVYCRNSTGDREYGEQKAEPFILEDYVKEAEKC